MKLEPLLYETDGHTDITLFRVVALLKKNTQGVLKIVSN